MRWAVGLPWYGKGVRVVAASHGAEWRYEDYQAVADGVRVGADLAVVAAELGRSVGAVQAAVNRMTPAALRLAGRRAVQWLQGRLAEGGYDWVATVRARLPGYGVWSAAADEALLAGWTDRIPIQVLAARSGVKELAVLRRLIRLGLAAHVVEVVDRIGCTPGGAVDTRYRLAKAEAEIPVFVAVAGVAGQLRVSVYGTNEAAGAAVDEFQTVEGGDRVQRSAVRSCTPGTWTALHLAESNGAGQGG